MAEGISLDDFMKPPPAPTDGGSSQGAPGGMSLDDFMKPSSANAPVKEADSRKWTDVPLEAVKNVPKSTADFFSAMVQPFLHPKDTADAMASIAKGVGAMEVPKQMVPVKLENGQTVFQPKEIAEDPEAKRNREAIAAPAQAVVDHFVERYGTEEGFKKAIATDPIGVLGDIAMVLTAGGFAAARAPGIVGKAGQIAGKLGAAVDPVQIAGSGLKRVVNNVVEPLAAHGLGFTTGAGAESVRTAGRVGMEGGETAEAFRDHMRGAPVSDVVDRAKAALDEVRVERSKAYQEGHADLSKDKTVLDFQPIEDAIAKANEVGTFKGVTINRKASETVEEINGIVREWSALDPTEFHTPAGLDALKRTVGDVRDSTQYGTPARVAADRVYNVIRNEIANQAPGYSAMMEGYSKASDLIKELDRTFSLGERASGDTAARKLVSATRNNVQTNFGERQRLLDVLAEKDPTLPAAIAGQSMNAALPRGIVARGGSMLAAGGAGTHALTNPLTVLPLAAFSPRIVGETVYLSGKAVGAIDSVAQAFGITPEKVRLAAMGAFQTGRAKELSIKAVASKVMAAGTVDDAVAAAESTLRDGSQ